MVIYSEHEFAYTFRVNLKKNDADSWKFGSQRDTCHEMCVEWPKIRLKKKKRLKVFGGSL